MNKIINGLGGVLIGFMVLSAVAVADGSAAIMETYTGDSQISVYLKGVKAGMENVSIQIATTEAESFSAEIVSELDKPMMTMVMIDNSVSISKKNREKIAQFLQNVISDKLDNEELCIATFSEDINILVDYTAAYSTLKQGIDNIAYQDQETYLTDVLYDLISAQYIHSDEDVYRRIIVVSDGVDNKSLGYTKDELYSLLKDVKVPIYTIGSVNKNNNDQLENMFSLSRMTSAEYFLLDDIEDVLTITESLNKDQDIVRMTITPAQAMMDGSKKTVKITFSDASVLTTEITMPQQVQEKVPQEEPVEESAEPVEESVEPVVEMTYAEDNLDTGINYFNLIFIAVVVIVVIVLVCVVLLILRKKKSQQVKFETLDDNIMRNLEQDTHNTSDKTEMIDSFHNNRDDGSTVMIWNQNTTYQVVLTDVNSPAKSYRVPLSQSIIIGRKKEICDIALDYEKTVSGKHCEIFVKGGKFYVKDLQSSNGTYVNGSKVLTESEIVSGNILKFGRLEMRFEVR